jgi:hypothetical protein
MLKALFIGAFMFAHSLVASAHERTPGPRDAPSVAVQTTVAHRQRAADISSATENSSFENERWLDKALDRKLLICHGC